VDYRYQEEGNQYRAVMPPARIAELCAKVAAAEELAIAGFDFRVTRDDEWYCLEVNAMPTSRTRCPLGSRSAVPCSMSSPERDLALGRHSP
jgi:hypothetical protein